ncbi:MAG: helix-turn-helix domain-containing protein [Thiocapsa sp.]|nr:helix-turn-helix domain-containing protein [Thiocapsa sp.]
MNDAHRTLDLVQAAQFLHVSPSVLREKANAGVIPGAKAGRRWVFLEADLVAYLRSLYPRPRRAVHVCDQEGIDTWHCTAAGPSGGSASPHRMARAYASLLELKTRSRHRSTTTD